MSLDSEFSELLGCAAVGAVIVAGSIWFYLGVLCSAQHLLAASRSGQYSHDLLLPTPMAQRTLPDSQPTLIAAREGHAR